MEKKERGTGISKYVRAGYSHYFVTTDEVERAIASIKADLAALGRFKDEPQVWSCAGENPDPLAALSNMPANSVLILKNLAWFLKDQQTGEPQAGIVQFLLDTAELFRSQKERRVVISIGSAGFGALPTELTREFVPLEFDLPSSDELRDALKQHVEQLQTLAGDKFVAPKDGLEFESIVSNGRGFTLVEFQNAVFLAAIEGGGRIDPDFVKKMRAKFIAGVAGVKYVEYTESFDNLLGYDVVKGFVSNMAPPTDPRSKGMLLLGPPGTGKSHLAKSLAGHFGMLMLTIEMSEMSGSLVGETEEKVRRFIQVAKVMAPCILFIDEIEKGLSGVGGGGQGGMQYSSDSLNQRAWAPFLKFMQDRGEHIYIIATCNNISQMPPEYLRAERWDTAPFFIDLPTWDERKSIVEFYKKEYEVTGKLTDSDTEGWSGAEIKSACRLASIGKVKVEESAKYIIPISSTMAENIDALRRWSKGRTLPASKRAEKTVGGREIDLLDLVKVVKK